MVARQVLEPSLLRGGGLVLGARAVAQLLRFGSMLFLARILAPDAFGVVGIALLAMAALTTLTDTGFEAALVQRRGSIEHYLSTVFSINVARAVVLSSVLFLSSSILARFFAVPSAVGVLKAVSIVVLIEGFTNPAAVAVRRDLKFRHMAIWEFAEAAAGFVAAIAFGLWLGNVYAIVLSLVSAQIARTAASYALQPFRPRFEIHWSRAGDLARFGVWILLTNSLVFLLLYIDDAAVIKMLGASALGLYQIGFRIANIPVTEMSHIVARISYPAYAQMQFDARALKARWLGTLSITTLIAVPAAAVIGLIASDLVEGVLGDQWIAATPIVQIVALFAALRSVNAACGPLFNALGHPRRLAGIAALQLLVVVLTIVPAVRSAGLMGAAWSVTAANACACALVIAGAAKLAGAGARDVLRAFQPGILVATALFSLLLIAGSLFPENWGPAVRLSGYLITLGVCGVAGMTLRRTARPQSIQVHT